jgi:hypothetical protein
MRRKIIALGIGLALSTMAAVSAVPVVAGAAGATTSASKVVVLKYSSNGKTVPVNVGDVVEVKLSGHHLQWSVAQVVQSSPVLSLVSEGTTTTGASLTIFRVVNFGTASLQATGTPICPPTGACPQYVVLWQANVTSPVVDPPPPAAT